MWIVSQKSRSKHKNYNPILNLDSRSRSEGKKTQHNRNRSSDPEEVDWLDLDSRYRSDPDLDLIWLDQWMQSTMIEWNSRIQSNLDLVRA